MALNFRTYSLSQNRFIRDNEYLNCQCQSDGYEYGIRSTERMYSISLMKNGETVCCAKRFAHVPYEGYNGINVSDYF